LLPRIFFPIIFILTCIIGSLNGLSCRVFENQETFLTYPDGFTVLQRDIERKTTFASPSLSFRVAVEYYIDRQDDTDKRIALFERRNST